MTDVKVEQCDYDMAKPFFNEGGPAFPMLAEAFARHRQAAEKAQQERDAGIADAHRQARLEAAKNAHARKVKAEARDHESMAIEALHIATAIRSQGHE